MICNCIRTRGLPPISYPSGVLWSILCDSRYLYVNGDTVTVKAISSEETNQECFWKIFVDDVEYSIDDLKDYFEINVSEREFSIKAINKDMVKYVVKIGVFNPDTEECYDSVEMEVKL